MFSLVGLPCTLSATRQHLLQPGKKQSNRSLLACSISNSWCLLCPCLFLAVTFELFLEGQQTENLSYLVITSTWLILLSGALSFGHAYLLNFTWLTLITAQVSMVAFACTHCSQPNHRGLQSFRFISHSSFRHKLMLWAFPALRSYGDSFHPAFLLSRTDAGVGVKLVDSL